MLPSTPVSPSHHIIEARAAIASIFHVATHGRQFFLSAGLHFGAIAAYTGLEAEIDTYLKEVLPHGIEYS
jgi:hypothetical protein